MKGNISLKNFIEDVKNELREASESDDPFFIMNEVELEVSFALDTKGKAGAKLIVFDIGGEVNAAQMHKVKLKLTPFKEEKNTSNLSSVMQKRRQPRNVSHPITVIEQNISQEKSFSTKKVLATCDEKSSKPKN